MQEKDRKVVILMASMLFVLSLVNIINNTVVVSADGKKQIEIFGRTFTKANIKRTIFKQVLTLVLRGLYTLCRDKKMKYLAFFAEAYEPNYWYKSKGSYENIIPQS